MGACGKIDLGGPLVLKPFEQGFRFIHTNYVTKYCFVLVVCDWHYTISFTLSTMSTEPSPMRADPE